MADNETTNTEEQKPAEKVEGQEPEQTTEQGTEASTEQAENSEETTESTEEQSKDGEGEESKLSHEDALAALAKTRKSEANMRVRLREAEEKLANAKTPEEVEAAINEIKTANAKDAHALVVENVALQHRLPEDLAQVLADASEGKTREDLEAHAKVLAKYAPVEETNDPELSGGLDPNDSPDDFDPKAEAQKVRRARRRGRY